jgi:hypothetical protein
MPAAVAFLSAEMLTSLPSTLALVTSFLFKHDSLSISIYLTIYLRLSERKLDATLSSMPGRKTERPGRAF